VSNPAEVVSVAQKVEVTVMEVDANRKRISLSLKKDPFGKNTEGKHKGKLGKKKEQNSAEGDLQAKLAALKGKFS
jgi:uncharacterized protein